MNSPNDIARSINQLNNQLRSGTLRIWGEWFGRPYDNMHVCTSCEAQPDHVVLHFNGGEQLCVWRPDGVSVSAAHLRIERASKVRWDWYDYGRPKTPENRHFREYTYQTRRVTLTADQPLSDPTTADPNACAAELVRL